MSATTPGFDSGVRARAVPGEMERLQPGSLQCCSRIAIAAQAAETGKRLADALRGHDGQYAISVFEPPIRHTDGAGIGDPDVLVIEDKMLERPLQAAVARLLQQRPQLRILVFGAGLDDDRLAGLLDAGAHDYLELPASPADIRLALERVLADKPLGQRYPRGDHRPASAGAEVAMQAALRGNIDKLCAELTRREKEILCQVIRGYAIKQIATEVHLSHQGVKMHLARLFRKFGASNRNQLILAVMDRISPLKGLCAVLCEELKRNLAQTHD